MSREKFLDDIEAYGEGSERVVEAYAEQIDEVSNNLEVDIDLEQISPLEIHVGDTDEEYGKSYVCLSDPDEYQQEMLDNFVLAEGVDSIFESSNYPVHEVSESAGHLVGEITVNGRDKNSARDTVIGEFFGGVGLGVKDPVLLSNDRQMLERNLDLQEDFFNQKHIQHVQNNLRDYRSVVEEFSECLENESIEEIKLNAEQTHKNLLNEVPSTLADFERYSWSPDYDVGTFSEFFVETYVVPGGGTLRELDENVFEDNELLEEDINDKLDALESMGKGDIEGIRDRTYAKGSENNRAYLTARILAEEALGEGSIEPSQLVQKSNSEVWRQISTRVGWINNELRSEYNIPVLESPHNVSSSPSTQTSET